MNWLPKPFHQYAVSLRLIPFNYMVFFSGDLSLIIIINNHRKIFMSASGPLPLQCNCIRQRKRFSSFNVVKWELKVGNDSPQTRKLPVKKAGLRVFLWTEKNPAASLWHAVSSFRNFLHTRKWIRIISLLSANGKTKAARAQNRKQSQAEEQPWIRNKT